MEKPEITNYQGFGYIYWLFGHLISLLSNNFRNILRILSLLSICISAFIYEKSLKGSSLIKISLLAVFLTTPFFWYGGKLITPEFYIFPIIFYSYFLFLEKNKKNLAFCLSGLAAGIKLSALPASVPLFIYFILMI